MRFSWCLLPAGRSDQHRWVSCNASSGSGILAMVASEKKGRRSSCHSSCWSGSWLPTNRTIAASLGKMPTTLVRRLISLFNRSSGLVLQILRQCSWRKCRKASTSHVAASITGTAAGNSLRNISVTRCQWERTCSGAWITNTARTWRRPPCPCRLSAHG